MKPAPYNNTDALYRIADALESIVEYLQSDQQPPWEVKINNKPAHRG